jgi:hypothetical protein
MTGPTGPTGGVSFNYLSQGVSGPTGPLSQTLMHMGFGKFSQLVSKVSGNFLVTISGLWNSSAGSGAGAHIGFMVASINQITPPPYGAQSTGSRQSYTFIASSAAAWETFLFQQIEAYGFTVVGQTYWFDIVMQEIVSASNAATIKDVQITVIEI